MRCSYAAYFFFPARILAHLARCAAAILVRADADMVRLAGAELGVFPADTDCDCFRTLAHRAFCASAIFRREPADIIRFGRLVSPVVPAPFKDSIAEIAWFNFSKRNCVALRSSRSS